MWQQHFELMQAQFSGVRAYWQASEQNRLERWFTFPNFQLSAERAAEQLRVAGLADVEVEDYPADGRTRWCGWQAPKAWDVQEARLWLVRPHEELLADWRVVPQALVMYSGPCEMEADLVEWDGQLDADLTGKLPFTRLRINDIYPHMRRLGLRGIVSDFIGALEGVREPMDVADEVRWENSGLRPAQGDKWGFMLSPRQGERLRGLLRQGPVRVRAGIRSRTYDGTFKAVTGVVRGADPAAHEVLLSSHLFEPGANDNGSGVGVCLELARCLQQAVNTGDRPPPRRSIRFLFNWEGYGLMAWFDRHPERARHLLGGLNLDEIGVDQSLGHSVTHLFMPPAANPSVIGDLAWYLAQQILLPDIRTRQVADRAEIINDTITADPNLDVVLPCLIQYPARHYHTSGDTPQTLSPGTMERFGLLAGTHALLLANAGADEARWLGRLGLRALRHILDDVELRLVAGEWPFSACRTRTWFVEQVHLKVKSLERVTDGGQEAQHMVQEGLAAVEELVLRGHSHFPGELLRESSDGEVERAKRMVLRRLTSGAPKAWESLALTAAQEQEYRRILFGNNLDLVFHRLIYWADGKRTLLEIVERLEMELDELLRDRSIARTASGSSIAGSPSQLPLEAVLYLVDLLVRDGYLGVAGCN